MRTLVMAAINAIAGLRTRARCSELRVAPTARVRYIGIFARPPTRLSIGEESIFEGSIASDRHGSQVTIGKHTYIGASLLVCAERIDIGNDVLVSWGCTLIDHDSHTVEWAGRANDVRAWYRGEKDWQGIRVRPIRLEDKCWLGFNVTVLSGVTIGEGAVVGSGSVVTRDVAPYTVVAGNPARLIREIRHD